MQAQATRDLLTVPEAAAELGLHRQTTWIKALSGQLPATRVGNRFVIRRSDLEAFKRQLRQPRRQQHSRAS